jgi:transcriptional regulator with PAS, ATPase and Fis domain
MSYLRLIQDKIQDLAEGINSATKVDVTVVDENLVRIGGTGDYYSMIDEILKSGREQLNTSTSGNCVCKECHSSSSCREMGHIAYPIKVEKKVIGVIGFIAFNDIQKQLIIDKKDEYLIILQNTANLIENEISKIKVSNSLNIAMAEVNEIINSINKGIIIISSDKKISHINIKALNSLNMSLSKDHVIGKDVTDIITNINIKDTHNKEVVATWHINDGREIKVLYKSNDLVLNQKRISSLISFDEIRDIISIAMNYTTDDSVNFPNIIGKSSKLLNVIEKATIVAQSDSTILLNGESGTGKELFARAIHNSSPRKDEAFVAINCTCIPENLLESELFGYEKGAFTGANIHGKIGKFELANNGTLFLDEIGDLPLHLQPKLLRAIQEREIYRVGGSNPIKVNIRIISATHRNLEELVENKMFRQDLFYRLNVIPLNLPSLRERETDVLILSEYILNRLCKRMGISIKHLSKDVEEKFLHYEWPGNVRELENVLEYAVNLSISDEITLSDLPDYLKDNDLNNDLELEEYINIDGTLEQMISKFEKDIINKCLDKYGNTTEGKKNVANKLGIGLTTLYRKINE